ncbi:MAG: TIGR04255 family protein [Planctomycetota bacterium]
MQTKDLNSKPLVEAIFEIRWKLQSPTGGINIDPHYKIVVGMLYNRLKEDYPEHKPLPSASVPDEIAGYVIQHQFRRIKEGWPVVQIGPGILTVNDTKSYHWDDFKTRCLKTVKILFEVYPDAFNSLKIEGLLLRYIDAYNFDYNNKNILEFLKEKMKTTISLPDSFFTGSNVKNMPLELDTKFVYPLTKPQGVVVLRLVNGQKERQNAIIWETMVQSKNTGLPQIPDNLERWLEESHSIMHDWFFKLIEGALEKEFE